MKLGFINLKIFFMSKFQFWLFTSITSLFVQLLLLMTARPAANQIDQVILVFFLMTEHIDPATY